METLFVIKVCESERYEYVTIFRVDSTKLTEIDRLTYNITDMMKQEFNSNRETDIYYSIAKHYGNNIDAIPKLKLQYI